MEYKKTEKAFASFSNYHVLVIGDVMLDSYLWGRVGRISPEAPVPVLDCKEREHRLGGAANVVRNLLALGVKPHLCAVIGEDEKGRLLSGLLEEQGVDVSGLVGDKTRPTTVKTRVIAGNQHLLRVDDEVTTPVSLQVEKLLRKKIEEILSQKQIDSIVFEDYDKGLISAGLIKYVTSVATEKNIPVLVDPKKRNFKNYKNITLYKPNFKEFVEGTKQEFDKHDIATMDILVAKFMEKQSIDCLLLTLAEAGIFVRYKDKSMHIPTLEKLDVADVSGAGDTVISVAAACLIAGLPYTEIARIANIAGGLVCEKPGVVTVDKEQLLQKTKSVL